jgi:hypothetical protein
MERRPAGVVIAAIALGFVSLAVLAFAAMTALSMAMLKNGTVPVTTAPGMATPPVGMVVGMLAFVVMLELTAAVWGGVTMVGLLKMKGWARISIMILGGMVAAFALLAALGSAVMPAMMKDMPLPANANLAQMHLVFAAMAAISLLVAAVGIWWLVYFALGGTRKAFAAAAAGGVTAAGGTASPVRSVAAVNPMTDFTFAQPLPPEERVEKAAEPVDSAE